MGKFSNAALRLTAGALILDAGVKKLKADEGTYAFLQQMAATGVPAVSKLDAATFGKLISGAETTRRNPADSLHPRTPGGRRPDRIRGKPDDHVLPQPGHARQVLPPHPGRPAARKQHRDARRRPGTAGLQEVSPTR